MKRECLGAERTFKAKMVNLFHWAQNTTQCLKKCGFAINNIKKSQNLYIKIQTSVISWKNPGFYSSVAPVRDK